MASSSYFCLLVLICCLSTAEPISSFDKGTDTPSDIVYVLNMTYVFNLSRQNAFEHLHIAAAISGLANREQANFYTILIEADADWLSYLRGPGEWLHGVNIQPLQDILQVVEQFRGVFKGAVLYDPNVPATSNLASTACGSQSLLPVCYRPSDPSSLYSQLVASGPKLPVVENYVSMFNGSVTGSSKCDVYAYMIEKYIKTALNNASYMGYYIDYFWTTAGGSGDYTLSTVPNHDFFIARKGVFFDLDVWSDEAPNDDPKQPLGTDRQTLMNMLLSAYKQTKGGIIHIGGFTPWAFKYVGPHSQHDHGGVDTEWESVRVFSAYNAFVDADACCINVMSNAAFYQHYPLPTQLNQNPMPTVADLKAKGYIDSSGKVVPKNYAMFYVGDYDSAAWLYSQLKGKWDDPSRGKVPLGWAIDPELSLRFPVLFPYLYKTRTATDYFISGDSGAGYLNPTQLIPPRQVSNITESGAEAWTHWNKPLYSQFNMSFTGFVIQGRSGTITDSAEAMYSVFSPSGIVLSPPVDPDSRNLHAYHGMPIFKHVSDVTGDPSTAANTILEYASPYTKFYMFRTILQNASYHYEVSLLVKAKASHFEFVDPYTLSVLAKVYLGLM